MPTLRSELADGASIHVDNAGVEETIAIWHLRAGRFEKAALAVRRAQAQLLQAELELLERASAAAPRARDQARGHRARRSG